MDSAHETTHRRMDFRSHRVGVDVEGPAIVMNSRPSLRTTVRRHAVSKRYIDVIRIRNAVVL